MDIETFTVDNYLSCSYTIDSHTNNNKIKLYIIYENNFNFIRLIKECYVIHLLFSFTKLQYTNLITVGRYCIDDLYYNLLMLDEIDCNNILYLCKSMNKISDYCNRKYLKSFKHYKYILPYLAYDYLLLIYKYNYLTDYIKIYNIDNLVDKRIFNASCYMKLNNYIM